MSREKAMTLRLSSWHAIALRCMADAEGKSVSDVVRVELNALANALKREGAGG